MSKQYKQYLEALDVERENMNIINLLDEAYEYDRIRKMINYELDRVS